MFSDEFLVNLTLIMPSGVFYDPGDVKFIIKRKLLPSGNCHILMVLLVWLMPISWGRQTRWGHKRPRCYSLHSTQYLISLLLVQQSNSIRYLNGSDRVNASHQQSINKCLTMHGRDVTFAIKKQTETLVGDALRVRRSYCKSDSWQNFVCDSCTCTTNNNLCRDSAAICLVSVYLSDASFYRLLQNTMVM